MLYRYQERILMIQILNSDVEKRMAFILTITYLIIWVIFDLSSPNSIDYNLKFRYSFQR